MSGDQINDKQPATKEQHCRSSLSDYAFDLLRGAATGAATGAVVGTIAESLVGAGAGGIGCAAVRIGEDAAIGAALGATGVAVGKAVHDAAAGGAAGAAKVGKDIKQAGDLAAGAAIAGAAATGGAAEALLFPGIKIAMEHKKEISQVGKEITSTPKDVLDHIKKNPVAAACETLVCPPLVIIDAKLRKYFGK